MAIARPPSAQQTQAPVAPRPAVSWPQRSPTTRSPILGFLRDHPLAGYFLLAFAFTWSWQLPFFALWHLTIVGPWVLLGPSMAGFVMAVITDGRGGAVRLLRRFAIWRVGLPWYLVVLLCLPAIWLLSLVLMPGGSAAFRVPGSSFLLTWLAGFVFAFFGATFVEEFGWRGFALPRLQARHGALVGTLILGSLWSLWHLPVRLFIPKR